MLRQRMSGGVMGCTKLSSQGEEWVTEIDEEEREYQDAVGEEKEEQKVAAKAEEADNSSNNKDGQNSHGSDEEGDLGTYLVSMTHELKLSGTVRRLMLNQFRKSNLSDQLDIVRSLEDELASKTKQRLRAHRHRKEVPHVDEEEEEEIDDEYSGNFANKDQTDNSAVDGQWEALIEGSHLSEEKKSVLYKQYRSQPGADERFNMFMEFSSYLRPMTEAGKQYLDLIEAQENRETSAFFSKSKFGCSGAMTTNMTQDMPHGATLKEQLQEMQRREQQQGSQQFRLFPGFESTPLFIIAVITTITIRLILGMYVTDE